MGDGFRVGIAAVRPLSCFTVPVVGCLLLGPALAQDDRKAAAEARSVEMRRIAESLSAQRLEGNDRSEVKLRGEPLLRWSDPTRDFSDASLWAWGVRGRPLALVSLELYPAPSTSVGATKWAYEFISLTSGSGALEVRGGERASKPLPSPTERIQWRPTKPGVTFLDFPEAPSPAPSATGRRAQMKELLKRFTCTAHPGKTVILRLMPHPLVHYSEPEAGLVDGAIFAFASGTNPEVLLLIEAQKGADQKESWRYAVARITAAGYEVSLDQREICSEPYNPGTHNASEPYFTIHLPRTALTIQKGQ